MTLPLWQRRTKEPLDEGERGGLKTQRSENEDLGIWSHHFMANRWEAMTGFIFLGFKMTIDSDCSHDIERLAPWKKNNGKLRQLIK